MAPLAAQNIYVHSLDPFAVRLGENFGIRWYGLSYLAGFFAAYLIIRRLALKKSTPMPLEIVGDFIFVLALGVIIGARAGFCLFYDQPLLWHFSSSFPFWGLLEVHRGGMSSHGGMLGIVFSCLYFSRRHNLSFLHLGDLTAGAAGLGIFFGRLANFVNGELYGRPCPPDLPWAVKFPQEILSWPFLEPQKTSDLSSLAQMFGISAESWAKLSAASPLSPTVEGVLNQIILAVQAGNQSVVENLAPLLTARHPSQIYEALLEGLLIFLITTYLWGKNLKPGLITGWFLVSYCIVRIFAEQFRMPDLSLGFQLFGLTRGQWISIFTLIAAAAFLTTCYRLPKRPPQGAGVD